MATDTNALLGATEEFISALRAWGERSEDTTVRNASWHVLAEAEEFQETLSRVIDEQPDGHPKGHPAREEESA